MSDGQRAVAPPGSLGPVWSVGWNSTPMTTATQLACRWPSALLRPPMLRCATHRTCVRASADAAGHPPPCDALRSLRSPGGTGSSSPRSPCTRTPGDNQCRVGSRRRGIVEQYDEGMRLRFQRGGVTLASHGPGPAWTCVHDGRRTTASPGSLGPGRSIEVEFNRQRAADANQKRRTLRKLNTTVAPTHRPEDPARTCRDPRSNITAPAR